MSVLRSYRIAHETEASQALSWFQKSIFADIPPYFMTHWKTGKSFFYGDDALLAYEETSSHLVVAGEALVAAGSDADELYRAFVDLAKRKKKKICGYYVGNNWFEAQFQKVLLGTSVRIPLIDFDLQSPQAKEVRRSLRKGDKLNYNVSSVKLKERVDQERIQNLQVKWKKKKLPFHLKFFLSKPQAENLVDTYEEWFVVEKDGEALAFCSLLPYLNNGELGFYVDHLIYDPSRDSHALGYLVSSLIEMLKEEGVSELNLGLNPFANVDPTSLMGRFFGFLYRVPFFYRPKGLHYFKKKFSGVEEDEYCFFQKEKSKWPGLIEMAKVTLSSPRKR